MGVCQKVNALLIILKFETSKQGKAISKPYSGSKKWSFLCCLRVVCLQIESSHLMILHFDIPLDYLIEEWIQANSHLQPNDNWRLR